MKPHKELNQLIVGILETNHKKNLPSARELFYEAKIENPVLVRKGFKSFVKVVSSFKNIEVINKTYAVAGKP